jgi:ATP-binding cassette subfamily B protein
MTIPVPIMLFCIYRHGEHMKNLFLRGWRKWTEVTNVLSDTIPGIQVVKAFNQEEREKKRFNKRNDDVTVEFNNIHRSWTKFWPALMLSMHLTIITVWWMAIPRLFSESTNHSHLSAGVFVSFLLYVTMFSTPIEIIGQMARMLNRALSSAHRVFEILDTNPSIDSSRGKGIELDVKGDISFKRVCFSYDGVRKVVDQMSFDIEAGEMIGLVGASGGGKSTLTKLLTRFYDIDSGKITIDGVNLKDLKLGSFRKQVGMVLQDPYLFHGSIYDNIAYGLDGVDRRKVVEAAKVANAHEFILRLPHGYDTVVGEKGHTLSGGERQRISIARAVLTDPKILILDEATSAVDTETERKIQDALDKLVEGRTVLAIAHRLSTLRKADRIFVVEKGSIKEKGTHSELLAKEDGTYRKLQQMQREMDEAFVV